MKPTEQVEKEVLEVYEKWLYSYLNGDVETYNSYLDDQYHFIGSTNNEEFLDKKDTTKFFEATAEQFAGKTEIRNSKRNVEFFGDLTFITEVLDAFFLSGTEWHYYGRFRFSSVLKKKEDGWRFIYQHFSTPDSKAQEGQTIGYDQISEENLKLREAIKRRTVELEQKNRELKIEAALEKVRARSSAMQNANELGEVISIIFQKLDEFDISVKDGVALITFNEGSKDLNEWMANPGFGTAMNFRLPFFEHPVLSNLWEAKNSGEDILIQRYTTEESRSFLHHLFEYSDFKHTPQPVKDYCLAADTYATSIAFQKHTAIFINDYSGISLTSLEIDLLKRFSLVFEQTYVRFLDLQKAEAAAREAKIEAALERLRSRSLAMHHSGELRDVIAVFFDKLIELGALLGTVGIALYDHKSRDIFYWVGNSIQDPQLVSAPFDESMMKEDNFISQSWKAVTEKTEMINVIYSKEQKDSYFEHLFAHNDLVQIPESAREVLRKMETHTVCFIPRHHSALFVDSWDGRQYAEDDIDILRRSGKVFEQAYVRFLDLQKAEAAAREAEIQLALERVRAQTMAMTNSDGLSDVLSVLFEQFEVLGISPVYTFLSLIDVEKNSFTYRQTGRNGTRVLAQQTISLDAMDVWQDSMDRWKAGNYDNIEAFHTPRQSVAEVFRVFDEIYSQLPESSKVHPADFPDGFYSVQAFSRFGSLGYDHHRPSTDKEKSILFRFNHEFVRLYQRFLDLQKSEAAAREAEIQLALERVRARSMAMQRSKDLAEAAQLLYQQFHSLGIKTYTCAFMFIEEEKNRQQGWAVSSEGTLLHDFFDFPLTGDAILDQRFASWKNKQPIHEAKIQGEANKQHHAFLASTLPPEFAQHIVAHLPDQIFCYNANFLHGYLFIVNTEPFTSQEKDIAIRFAKVFEQTYTRFLDLQTAEAAARKAQIEVALERIRSISMAIRKSSELMDIIHTVFGEWKKLGLELYECNINLLDRTKKEWLNWGTGIGEAALPRSFRFPWFDNPFVNQLYEDTISGISCRTFMLEGDDLSRLLEGIFTKTDFKNAPKEYRDALYSIPSLCLTHAYIQYGSMDIAGAEPPPQATIDILKRFSKVFEQAYTRYLDVVQAEAQAREAEIEAALERVRSRSMGMQKSEELQEVIKIVYQQITHLKINCDHAGFVVDYTPGGDWHFWIADELDIPAKITHPYFDSVWANQFNEAKAIGANLFATHLNFEEKNRFYNELLSHVPGIPAASKDFYLSCPALAASTVLLEDVGLYIENFSGTPYTEEENNMLLRFGKVFQQTYTRFLDLQKAEAQAREALVEAALERVRSRAMAMQKTSELLDGAELLHKQLSELGVNSMNVSYAFIDEDEKFGSYYSINPVDGRMLPIPFIFPHTETAVMCSILAAWKNQEPFKVIELNEEATLKHQTYIGEHIRQQLAKSNIPFSVEDFLTISPKKAVLSTFNFSKGYLFHIAGERLSNGEEELMLRFTRVFEQTYTRFLDLQKAEAQAREAKIEAALEKVRTRTMAMQKGEELKDVAVLLYKELIALGITNFVSCGYVEINENINRQLTWVTSPGGDSLGLFYLPVTGDATFDERYAAWQRQQSIFHQTVAGKVRTKHLEYAITTFNSKEAEQMVLNQFPDPTVFYCFNFSHGYLHLITGTELKHEEELLLARFTRVFEQTYARFLDLQKAEAQARESQIEAALERVRSRSMGMQKSDELTDVAGLLFKQVIDLGINSWTAGFNVWSDDNNSYVDYITSPNGGFIEPYTVITDRAEALQDISNARKSGVEFDVQYVEGEKIRQLYIALTGLGEEQFKKMQQDGTRFPSHQYEHFVFGSKVSLMFITYEPVPEAHDIFKRFGRVFEQTYTRFNDLKRAEAQALEAVKRASVDRVRAEIASMRTTNDLSRITPLIWNELTTLGVPFIRCGVFIMEEENQQVQTYLSTPDGKAIASFRVPYNTPGQTKEIITHWQRKEMYTQHWDESAFIEYTNTLVQQGAINSGEKYLTENRPTNLYLHFLPFLQGMLYAGSETALTKDELQLVQNLADAFATAYARYDDFNKLESAKEQIERTLVDLKLAQSQLIQSEKMASLGELTAGIAHEIQNPLNFVNNFSELSNELIDEMNQELALGNVELAGEIAGNIKKNLEKINHHGKRAESIVTGMLQHSRTSAGQKEPTDINKLADEYLRLSYHGFRAKNKQFNCEIIADFDKSIGSINIIGQDIGRVILNLINNAFYAIDQKKKGYQAEFVETPYKPTVNVKTMKINNEVLISVADNGNGISQKMVDKIFQPFFTTKPTGEGTGLGLSLSYDIVKAHGGELKVETKESEGSTFIIHLLIG